MKESGNVLIVGVDDNGRTDYLEMLFEDDRVIMVQTNDFVWVHS